MTGGLPTADPEKALAEYRRQNEALRGSNQQLQLALADQKSQNEALIASTSWRITAPLRAVAHSFRTIARAARRLSVPRLNGNAQGTLAASVRADGAAIAALQRGDLAASVFRDGFLGPFDLFTRAQCEIILRHFRLGSHPPPVAWHKGRAASDRFIYDIATRPQLVNLLRPLLGDDIVLWGASLIERAPGETHTWHTDIECSALDGRFASVWIGLENTSRASALQLISRSHLFGKPMQQVVQEHGLRRGEASNEMVAAWAQQLDPVASFAQPGMTDGQVLIFDGRLWHGSHNNGARRRTALLLQYASTDAPIFIPDFNQLEWPFRLSESPPPRVWVRGNPGADGVLAPPAAVLGNGRPIVTHVEPGRHYPEGAQGWVPYGFFQGPTPVLAAMESHLSVLSPGHSPHPPHSHVEEELLIVLSGEGEILIAEGPDAANAQIHRLEAGSFIYCPAYQHHTIRNGSTTPVTYLMFKWQGAPIEVDEPLGTTVFQMGGTLAQPTAAPMSSTLLFEAPTSYLTKLHAHVTDLQPGGGYAPHADAYDVGIVAFSGEVQTLGEVVVPNGLVFYSTGELHGMHNVSSNPARYLVFEFHAPRRLTLDVS